MQYLRPPLFAPNKKKPAEYGGLDFLVEQCPGSSLSACVTDIYFHPAETLEPAPRPNLEARVLLHASNRS